MIMSHKCENNFNIFKSINLLNFLFLFFEKKKQILTNGVSVYIYILSVIALF